MSETAVLTPKSSVGRISRGGSSAKMSEMRDDASVADTVSNKPSLREEISARKEQKKLEEQAQFTYKPASFTQKSPFQRKEKQGQQENRFEKLYSDAVNRHISEQIQKTEGELAKQDPHLTFKPRISSKAANLSRSSSRERLGMSRTSSRSSLLDDQSVGSSNGGSSVRSLTRSRSATPTKSEFSFQPTITKRAHSVDRKNSDRNMQIPRTERLYQNSFDQQEKLAQMRQSMEERAMTECTFAPAIKENPRSLKRADSSLSITERLNRRGEEQKLRLEDAKQRVEEEMREQATFKPLIKETRRSRERSQERGDVVSRLLTPSEASKNSQAALRESRVELTFQPKCVTKRSASPNSAQLVRQDSSKSVHDKLFSEGVAKKRERDTTAEHKRTELSRDCTFKPTLHATTPTIRARAASPSDPSALFSRLTLHKPDDKRLDKVRKETTKDFTFQPQLSQGTEELLKLRQQQAAERGEEYQQQALPQRLAERAERTRQTIEARRTAQEVARQKEEAETLTFKPVLSPAVTQMAQSSRRRSRSASKERAGSIANGSSSQQQSEVDEDNLSVFSRLSHTHTSASRRHSHMFATASQANAAGVSQLLMDDDVSEMSHPHSPVSPHHRRGSTPIRSSAEIDRLVDRLATPKRTSILMAEQEAAAKKAAVASPPPISHKAVEEVVDRLCHKKTQAFLMASDPERRLLEQEKVIQETRKPAVRRASTSMDKIFERLSSGASASQGKHQQPPPTQQSTTSSKAPQTSSTLRRSSSASSLHSVGSTGSQKSQRSTSHSSRLGTPVAESQSQGLSSNSNVKKTVATTRSASPAPSVSRSSTPQRNATTATIGSTSKKNPSSSSVSSSASGAPPAALPRTVSGRKSSQTPTLEQEPPEELIVERHVPPLPPAMAAAVADINALSSSLLPVPPSSTATPSKHTATKGQATSPTNANGGGRAVTIVEPVPLNGTHTTIAKTSVAKAVLSSSSTKADAFAATSQPSSSSLHLLFPTATNASNGVHSPSGDVATPGNTTQESVAPTARAAKANASVSAPTTSAVGAASSSSVDEDDEGFFTQVQSDLLDDGDDQQQTVSSMSIHQVPQTPLQVEIDDVEVVNTPSLSATAENAPRSAAKASKDAKTISSKKSEKTSKDSQSAKITSSSSSAAVSASPIVTAVGTEGAPRPAPPRRTASQSDDFEAKLLASMAMLKPLDDLPPLPSAPSPAK